MIKNVGRVGFLRKLSRIYLPKQTFLTNEYKCNEAWNVQTTSAIVDNLNLHEFYNLMDQNYSSKGIISAIDVDVFANAVKDPSYLEELKDLLHKLRLSADTGNTLESTHYAAIRKYIEFGHLQELVNILKDPLNFGIFLDSYTANILLDKLLTSQNYELAAEASSVVMLQEDFSNELTCALCQYAAYKFLTTAKPKPDPPEIITENTKVEEKKIRVKFLRNEYFDDHFDLKDIFLRAGKTLALISREAKNNVNYNLQIIGWLFYKKYDKLLNTCELMSDDKSFKIYNEVIELINKVSVEADDNTKAVLDNCIVMLSKFSKADTLLEESIKICIENAINKVQAKDVLSQQELFKSWAEMRKVKLEEQAGRLDRKMRIKLLEEKQKTMEEREQKLWFFENEEQIDLEIEKKKKLEDASAMNEQKKIDDTYIPPEIVRKHRT